MQENAIFYTFNNNNNNNNNNKVMVTKDRWMEWSNLTSLSKVMKIRHASLKQINPVYQSFQNKNKNNMISNFSRIVKKTSTS